MAFVFRAERNFSKYQNENANDYQSDQVNNLIFSKQKDNVIEDTNLVNNRYNINLLDPQSPPFLSKVERIKKSKENSPGPGAYNISEGYYNKHRQFSSRQDNAIPEQYELFDLPLLRMKEVINDNPGPGHYNPSEKDLFGGKFKKNNSLSLNSKNNNINNSLSNKNSKSINIIFKQNKNNINKDNSNDIDNNINQLLYISSPRKKINENSPNKKKNDEGDELVENLSMKNIRGPLSIQSTEEEKKIKENFGRRINKFKNNNSKMSGITLDTERTSINSTKLSHSQAMNYSPKIMKKINYQSNKNIYTDSQDTNHLYNRLVSSTDQNEYRSNTLFPILKYDKSRIYRNEHNHERLIYSKDQKTNYFRNNLVEFDKLLNSEYFSQAPGPGYYDPIDSSNQKYYNPKNIKNYFNISRSKNVTSLIKTNKLKNRFPSPGQYKVEHNMIENKIKTNMDKKMRDILYDVKKIAKLRIIREKEALERNKLINDILNKEKDQEKQKCDNNTKEIYDNNIMKYKDIHAPNDLLFNFGANDKRFKEKINKNPGPGEYEMHLYKSIEEKNANIVETPSYKELYDRAENKNNLLERFSLNKDSDSNPPIGYYNPDIISSIKYNAEYKNQIKMPAICRNISSKYIEDMTFKKAEEIKEKEKKLMSLLGPGTYFSMLNKSMNDMNKNNKNGDVTKLPPFGSSEKKLQGKQQDTSPGPGQYDINLYNNWITRTYNILFS